MPEDVKSFYEKIAKEQTKGIPNKVNGLDAIVKNAYYSEVSKGNTKVDEIVDKVYDAGFDYCLNVLHFNEIKDKEGRENLKELVQMYFNFDTKKMKETLTETFKQQGYIDNDAFEKTANYAAKMFEQVLVRKLQRKIAESISSEDGYKKFKDYIKEIGKSVNVEVKDEELTPEEKMIEKFLKITQRRVLLNQLS